MRLPHLVTPAEAQAVWENISEPSTRRVARALSQGGQRVHHSTIARWRAEGWRPVPNRLHPLHAARWALDVAAPVLTGDPTAGVEALLERRDQREELDRLPCRVGRRKGCLVMEGGRNDASRLRTCGDRRCFEGDQNDHLWDHWTAINGISKFPSVALTIFGDSPRETQPIR
jgi:hypothetical protein